MGATGLTLTRSHTVYLLDRPWTPGDVMQAEDRVRRIGQTADEIRSFWIVGFDIDKKLDSLLQTKDKSCQTVLADGTKRQWFSSDEKEIPEKKELKIESGKRLTADIRNHFPRDAPQQSTPTVSNGCQVAVATSTGACSSKDDSWNTAREHMDEKAIEESQINVIKELYSFVLA